MRFWRRENASQGSAGQSDIPPAPVGFITVKNRTLTPLAERFIEHIRKVANSDSGRMSIRRL
jgi:hypothetical protein